jgi:hypothetical protein
MEAFPDADDLDPNDDFDPETNWLVEEWPERFTWSCCEKDATGSPCTIQAHKPNEGRYKVSNE